MATLLKADNESDVLAVSGPGASVARQYRVQYRAEAHLGWRLYASFRLQDDAEACLNRLRNGGCRARLVRYCITPAAA